MHAPSDLDAGGGTSLLMSTSQINKIEALRPEQVPHLRTFD